MPALESENAIGVYKGISLFEGMTEEDIQCLIKGLHCYERSVKKGSFLFLMNETVNFIGIILSGKLNVIYDNSWGDKIILASLGKGNSLGENLLYSCHYKSQVTVQAAERAGILCIPSDNLFFSGALDSGLQRQFNVNLLKVLANKNSQLLLRLQILSEKNLRKKILSFLRLKTQEEGSDSITLSMNRAGFARYICANRTAVIRTINELKEEGVIDFHENTFTLLNCDNQH